MEKTETERIRELAVLWDELAGPPGPQKFHEEFLGELQVLNQFQSDFPAKSCDMLVQLLELKVLQFLRKQNTPDEIAAARRRIAEA